MVSLSKKAAQARARATRQSGGRSGRFVATSSDSFTDVQTGRSYTATDGGIAVSGGGGPTQVTSSGSAAGGRTIRVGAPQVTSPYDIIGKKGVNSLAAARQAIAETGGYDEGETLARAQQIEAKRSKRVIGESEVRTRSVRQNLRVNQPTDQKKIDTKIEEQTLEVSPTMGPLAAEQAATRPRSFASEVRPAPQTSFFDKVRSRVSQEVKETGQYAKSVFGGSRRGFASQTGDTMLFLSQTPAMAGKGATETVLSGFGNEDNFITRDRRSEEERKEKTKELIRQGGAVQTNLESKAEEIKSDLNRSAEEVIAEQKTKYARESLVLQNKYQDKITANPDKFDQINAEYEKEQNKLVSKYQGVTDFKIKSLESQAQQKLKSSQRVADLQTENINERLKNVKVDRSVKDQLATWTVETVPLVAAYPFVLGTAAVGTAIKLDLGETTFKDIGKGVYQYAREEPVKASADIALAGLTLGTLGLSQTKFGQKATRELSFQAARAKNVIAPPKISQVVGDLRYTATIRGDQALVKPELRSVYTVEQLGSGTRTYQAVTSADQPIFSQTIKSPQIASEIDFMQTKAAVRQQRAGPDVTYPESLTGYGGTVKSVVQEVKLGEPVGSPKAFDVGSIGVTDVVPYQRGLGKSTVDIGNVRVKPVGEPLYSSTTFKGLSADYGKGQSAFAEYSTTVSETGLKEVSSVSRATTVGRVTKVAEVDKLGVFDVETFSAQGKRSLVKNKDLRFVDLKAPTAEETPGLMRGFSRDLDTFSKRDILRTRSRTKEVSSISEGDLTQIRGVGIFGGEAYQGSTSFTDVYGKRIIYPEPKPKKPTSLLPERGEQISYTPKIENKFVPDPIPESNNPMRDYFLQQQRISQRLKDAARKKKPVRTDNVDLELDTFGQRTSSLQTIQLEVSQEALPAGRQAALEKLRQRARQTLQTVQKKEVKSKATSDSARRAELRLKQLIEQSARAGTGTALSTSARAGFGSKTISSVGLQQQSLSGLKFGGSVKGVSGTSLRPLSKSSLASITKIDTLSATKLKPETKQFNFVPRPPTPPPPTVLTPFGFPDFPDFSGASGRARAGKPKKAPKGYVPSLIGVELLAPKVSKKKTKGQTFSGLEIRPLTK